MLSQQASCKHSSNQSLHVNNKSDGASLHGSIGPTTYKSLGGNLYCLVIVDDYSRYTWVFFLYDKTEVAACFKKFAKRAQNEFEVKLKKIRSDNGKEFDNTNIEAYCDEVGIKHEVSTTYTHQQNSIVEKEPDTYHTCKNNA